MKRAANCIWEAKILEIHWLSVSINGGRERYDFLTNGGDDKSSPSPF